MGHLRITQKTNTIRQRAVYGDAATSNSLYRSPSTPLFLPLSRGFGQCHPRALTPCLQAASTRHPAQLALAKPREAEANTKPPRQQTKRTCACSFPRAQRYATHTTVIIGQTPVNTHPQRLSTANPKTLNIAVAPADTQKLNLCAVHPEDARHRRNEIPDTPHTHWRQQTKSSKKQESRWLSTV